MVWQFYKWLWHLLQFLPAELAFMQSCAQCAEGERAGEFMNLHCGIITT